MLNIGILNAIDPQKSQLDWNKTPIDGYTRFFQSVDAPFTFTGYNVALDEFPATIDECDAYVITGSPQGVYDDAPWIARLMDFIREGFAAGKKFVGICFGHQVLAHALGGYTAKSEKGWGFGLKTFAVTTRKPWITAPPGTYQLYFAHQDQVQRLPAGAELLGGNDFCPHAMFVIGDQILGVQGHPEFTTSLMESLVDHAAQRMDPAFIADVRASLATGRPDNYLFAQWLTNFLTAT